MEEIWKDIKGYEDCYQVSNLGRVISKERDIIYKDGSVKHRKERIMKPQNLRGYKGVNLYKENTYKMVLVHRLVADAFIQPENGKDEIDHINTIRSDNRVENLRWVTRKENGNNPITRKHKSIACTETAKLLKKYYEQGRIKRIRRIVQLSKQGDYIRSFWGAREVEIILGFSASVISRAAKGIVKYSYGYKWAYEEDYLKENKD